MITEDDERERRVSNGTDQSADDETASKGSKESDNEKVIDTQYDDDRDNSVQIAIKNSMLRRKSMAPPVLHE